MSEFDHLPIAYVSDGNQQVHAPTYEALAQLYIVMSSPETGQTGPTLVEAGEHFTTEAIPCMQWMPLNKAAGERVQAWIDSLPAAGGGITLDEFAEAATAMRPREGEPTLPHDQWWAAVTKYAETKKKARQGMVIPKPLSGFVHRVGAHLPVMPYAAAAVGVPLDQVGRAPQAAPIAQHVPQNKAGAATRARGARITPVMANTQASDSPQRATG